GGLDTTTNQLVFDVTFNSHFAHDFALSLGSNAANLGLTLGGNTTVSVDASVDMDVQFGIDLNHFLSNPAAITPSDVFLQVNRLSASGSVDTNNLNFSIGFGGASLSVVNGSLHFTPKGTLAVQKPDGTKRITLQDLLSTNLGDFVTLNATGA